MIVQMAYPFTFFFIICICIKLKSGQKIPIHSATDQERAVNVLQWLKEVCGAKGTHLFEPFSRNDGAGTRLRYAFQDDFEEEEGEEAQGGRDEPEKHLLEVPVECLLNSHSLENTNILYLDAWHKFKELNLTVRETFLPHIPNGI
jgi:hypothetical protein